MEKFMDLLPDREKEKLRAMQEFQAQFLTQEPKITECKGFILPPGMNSKCINYAYEDWDVPENSVFLLSFPKTGTNWVLEVIRRVIYGHDEKVLQMCKSIPLPFFVLEMGIVEKFDLLRYLPLDRLCFASHISEELFNYEKVKSKNGKVVYVVRNPKDQAVSWYHFTKNVPLFKKLRSEAGARGEIEWDEFFEKHMKGELPSYCRRGEGYAEHIRSWLKHRNDDHCLFVFYEDLQKDFPKEIQRIAAFLDVVLSDEKVVEIEDKCSFKNMKKEFQRDKMEIRKLITRKGVVGDWLNEFSESQSKRMEEHFRNVLGDCHIQFTYE